MGDVHMSVVGESPLTAPVRSVANNVANSAAAVGGVESPISVSTLVKSVLGVTSLTTLLFSIRSAYKHTRQTEPADVLARAQVLSGVGFAGKALALATVITVSGFSLLVVGISAALNVNTPRQFGRVMKEAFGDSLRLPQSQNSQSFEDLLKSIDERKQEQEQRKQDSLVSSQ